MKILQIISGLQQASGVTTFVTNVAESLQKIGHDVLICTRDRYPSCKDVHLSAYDVVHVHGIWEAWVNSFARKAYQDGVPVVWSTHGMTAPWSLRHKWWKKCLFWWFVQKPLLRRAAVIHSTVEKEREWNASHGFPRQVVAPLGTNGLSAVAIARSVRGNANSFTCLADSCRTLLYVGRVYPVKALDRLIEAFARVNVSGWKLRIVGPDQAGHKSVLTNLCKALQLRSVEFIGPMFGADLDYEYDNCDILALVSHTENFGATVVDAMAHGKPVITSTNTPWKEVADVGCGWWVDNDIDALAGALRVALNTPPSQLSIMGAKGRTLVESKYTWEAVAKKLERAYRDITQGCEKGLCASCPDLYDTCSP